MIRFSLFLVLLCMLAAAPAQGTTIYFACSTSICRIGPDGTARQLVASRDDYRSPSVALDGSRLAWIQSTGDLFTGDGSAGVPFGPISRFAEYAVISRDGTKVLSFEAGGQPNRVCVYDVGGGPCKSQGGAPITSAGWYPVNRVMISTREANDPIFQAHGAFYNNEICLEVAAGGGQCEKVLARDVDYQLDNPALSPDGSTLAVARTKWDQEGQGQIALYDVTTGALVRVLTSGPGDQTPFWSPDGSQIAFSRAGGIYVIGSNGAPGSEKLIAAGNSPTWSTLAAGSGLVKATAPRHQKGTKVRGTFTAVAGTRVKIDLVVKGRLVGRKIIASAPGGTRAFAVAVNSSVVKTLRSHHVRKLTLTVVVRGVNTVKRRVTLQL